MIRSATAISLGIAAWLLFIASFFLPATNALEAEHTPPGTPLSGWEAFWFSANLPRNWPLYRMEVRAEPKVLLFAVFPVTNLAMLIAPIVISRARSSRWLAAIILCGGIAALLLPKNYTKDLFDGFYYWDVSMFVMATACLLSAGWRKEWRAPPFSGELESSP